MCRVEPLSDRLAADSAKSSFCASRSRSARARSVEFAKLGVGRGEHDVRPEDVRHIGLDAFVDRGAVVPVRYSSIASTTRYQPG